MKCAYLFDIDGTLLNIKNKANRVVIQNVLKQFRLTELNVKKLDFAGKTDRAIFNELLPSPSEQLFEEVKASYLEELDAFLTRDHIHVLDGVNSAIDYLSKQGAWVGLLTGNFVEAARIKLGLAGLGSHFEFGAYGDDASSRDDLPHIAYKELQTFSGWTFHPADLFIIGDTPRDIRCAQLFGAVSVAVATGGYSADELRACSPDAVLDSMHEFPEWERWYRENRQHSA